MASTVATGLDVITTGATGTEPVGWISSGCVLVMLIAGLATGAAVALSSRAGGTGRITAPESVAIPGGFGNGWNSGGEADAASGVTGGRRGKTLGASAPDSAEGNGVIFGGNRRIGVTGVREGKTIRAVSCFSTLGTAAACSGRGGSAMRTGFLFRFSHGGGGFD
jgi:hypothetical protein